MHEDAFYFSFPTQPSPLDRHCSIKKLLSVNSVSEVRGCVIEHNNRKYLAGYHPAASFYREDMAENIRQDFALLRQELQKLVPRPEAC